MHADCDIFQFWYYSKYFWTTTYSALKVTVILSYLQCSQLDLKVNVIAPSIYVTISETDFHQPSVSILGYKPHLYKYVYIGSRINFHINFNAYIRLYLWFGWSRRLRRRSRHWSQSPNHQPSTKKYTKLNLFFLDFCCFLCFFQHFECL